MLYELITQLASDLNLHKNQIIEFFRVTGTIHLLAISGLHFAIVSFFCYQFTLKFLSLFANYLVRYDLSKFASLLTIITNLVFLNYVGYPISALRACIMANIFLLAKSFYIRTNILNIFVITFLLFLIKEISLIKNISFQLSFTATFALIIFFRKKTPHHNKIINFLSNNFFVSLICAAATLPIIIYHFHNIASYAIIVNFIITPIFSIFFLPLFLIGELLSLIISDNFITKLAKLILAKIVMLLKLFSELEMANLNYVANFLFMISYNVLFWSIVISKQFCKYHIILFIILLYAIMANTEFTPELIITKSAKILLKDNLETINISNLQINPYSSDYILYECKKTFCVLKKERIKIAIIKNKYKINEFSEICSNHDLIINLHHKGDECADTASFNKKEIWYKNGFRIILSEPIKIYSNSI